nr:adaptor protein MecA [Lachnospiraceae bacterium]
MKIEKVNDHQIRCTLTKSDLADRQLKISELAYGTEKAKSLFRDMMQQASFEFGFEAEDIPLMIEAIPLNSECIVLIITKVEDPEELDTRFSKFAPSVHETDAEDEETVTGLDGADAVLDLFKKIQESAAKDMKQSSSGEQDAEDPAGMIRLFSFNDLREVTRLAHVLKDFYNGNNALYKNTGTGKYLLLLNRKDYAPEAFSKVCNVISEYGNAESYTSGTQAF